MTTTKRSPGFIFAVWIASLFLAFPISLLNGLILMVAVAATHDWIHAVPTIGYWDAAIIAYGLSVFTMRTKTP